jgi:SOS-response transcriptional repressor LexA
MKTVTRTQFRECITRSDIFFVEIHFNSMRRAGISAGNLVGVDQDTSPIIGNLVLVAIESDWGIRKLIKSNGKVYLESDTERSGVREEYLVAGKVVMVVRGV